MTDPVLYEKVSNKAYITLNRPEAMNAMTPEGFRQLAEAFKEAGKDEDVRVVILTGTGEKAFCAGADLKETIPAIAEGQLDPNVLDDVVLKYNPLWKPIIAAVNGHCLAGAWKSCKRRISGLQRSMRLSVCPNRNGRSWRRPVPW